MGWWCSSGPALSPRSGAAWGSLEQGPPSSHIQATLPPTWLPSPKATQAAARGPVSSCTFWKVSPTIRDLSPFGSPQTSSPGPVSALWCHCACGEPLATSGAARVFGYFAHFINKCVLMPTTWKLLSGNRSGSMLWGVYWLDCGDRRNSDLGGEGRQAARWPNLGLLGASQDLWSL